MPSGFQPVIPTPALSSGGQAGVPGPVSAWFSFVVMVVVVVCVGGEVCSLERIPQGSGIQYPSSRSGSWRLDPALEKPTNTPAGPPALGGGFQAHLASSCTCGSSTPPRRLPERGPAVRKSSQNRRTGPRTRTDSGAQTSPEGPGTRPVLWRGTTRPGLSCPRCGRVWAPCPLSRHPGPLLAGARVRGSSTRRRLRVPQFPWPSCRRPWGKTPEEP